jgi:flagellar motor protein MotB
MKLYIILITLILSNLLLAKDSDYSLIIDKPFNNELIDITQDYDRDISAVGFINNYKTSSNKKTSYTNAFDYLASVNNDNGTHMQLIKADEGANIVIDKSIVLPSFSKAVSLIKTPDNGYYIGGHTMDGQLILLKVDSNANVIFKKQFGTKNFDRLKNLVKLSDGGVLAIGSSATSRDTNDPVFKSGLGLNDIFITRFNKNGYELWSKKYGTRFDDEGIDAVEAKDGSIMIISQTLNESDKSLGLMRIDENGNKIWLKKYEYERGLVPRKIIRLRDNNFLLSISYKDELYRDQIRLIKFDLRGNEIYDKQIFTKYSSAILDIKEFSDGGIIGAGYVKDTYNTDALVMVLDPQLKMLYQDHYGEDNYDLFNSLTILNNSQVAAAGIHTQNNSQESNMWIVKLNRDGTLAQISSNANDFYQKLLQLFEEEINSNKIRIKRDLTIEFLDDRLLFEVGIYKLNKTQEIFIEKFSNKLIPFIHKYQDIVKTLEVNGHTSSEWGDVSFTQNFLNNEKLSMNRAYSTMSFIFKNQNDRLKKYLSDIFKGSGYGFSKRIILDNDLEDKKNSRRVSFKIILNEKK